MGWCMAASACPVAAAAPPIGLIIAGIGSRTDVLERQPASRARGGCGSECGSECGSDAALAAPPEVGVPRGDGQRMAGGLGGRGIASEG